MLPVSTRRRAAALSAALAPLLVLGGCAGTPEPVIGPVAAQPLEAAGQGDFSAIQSPDYRLRPTDVVNVTVFREPDLSVQQIPIGADGMIALPLVGALQAEGRTTTDLARAVESALAGGYLTNPRVAVNIINYNSHRVTVEGAVKKSGVFTFVPGARLSSAIAQADGLDRVAKLDQVAVFRQAPEGLTVAKFDYRAVQQGTMIDPVLQPGDRVVVGTSGLSQLWQDVLRAVPVFAVFTQI